MTKLLARILTRSFPGKETSSYAGSELTETSDSTAESQASDYESRAFAMWGELVGQSAGNRILELGALSPRSLGYFAERGAMLSVMSVKLPESGKSLQSQLDESTPERPFDGCLCWDLPNYMPQEDFRQLGQWLGQNTRPGGVVMLCLATKIPYPSRPGCYVIVAGDRLQYEASQLGDDARQDRISTADLGRCWGSFEIERSFLLRNGMQEYVLRRQKP